MTEQTFTTLASVLLATIRQTGKAMTRQQIADAIGRPGRLTPHDISTLKDLAQRGLIEEDRRTRGVAGVEYVYKLPGSES